MFFKPLLSPERIRSIPPPATNTTRNLLIDELRNAELDKQALRAENQALRRHAVALDKYTTRLRHHLSAWSQMPKELLLEIFRLVCAENSFERRKSLHAVALASVCKHWRDVVVDDTKLWATARIASPFDHVSMTNAQKSNQLDLTKLFIKRATGQSGTVRPLTLEIDCESTASATIHLLMQHTASWHHIRIAGFHKCFDDPQPLDFPLLQSLELPAGNTMVLFEVFRNAQALHRLSVPFLSWQARVIFEHWSNIRVLELRDTPPSSIFATIHLCTSLESLTLTGIRRREERQNDPTHPPDPDPTSPPPQVMQLKELRTLSIILGSGRDEIGIRDLFLVLSRMQASKLAVLNIQADSIESMDCHDRQWENATLQSFLRDSDMKLKELQLVGLDICSIDLISLLRLSPTLVSLTVIEPTGEKDSYEPQTLTGDLLSTLDAEHGLVPNLEHILFERSSGLRFDRLLFVDMVCSRTSYDYADAGTRNTDANSGTLYFKDVAPLRSVSLRIEIPKVWMAGAAPAVDAMTAEVYEELRERTAVVVINDDDPRQRWEREPKKFIHRDESLRSFDSWSDILTQTTSS